jgi:cystathionine gamma-synthase|mmetsp:Transcript_108219/g.170601  ORF Transcript_108219/g.170601 Transcript_108219/m.170601 type:complete len:431 (-) Transcript_108219:188-1480(-)|eukprot:CAMPEP_0169114354 /NCGR_PEP_ID=MMETSP1015-20121227/28703_1 /TAXON_ID=342587 /ORGANISM="Karlodinium micrum, Strain CCMP2283" /LENGTH=430 /DNA_ID=CAMNT_0009176611 /DNA_START=58 /DNA_END=1350 /DNA_ORIENTATION=+
MLRVARKLFAPVRTKGAQRWAPGTACVWAGEDYQEGYNKFPWLQGVQVPVQFGVSYGYRPTDAGIEAWKKSAAAEVGNFGTIPENSNDVGFFYGRTANPTVSVLEHKLAVLEGAEVSVVFSSGMAAISAVLHSFLSPGERVVSIKDSYGGTSKIFLTTLPKIGVNVCLCETDDHEEIEAALKEQGTKLLYIESPTNPTIKVLDIARLAAVARAAGALVVVDNTFATPLNQSPFELGADIVIHAMTKFIAGHGDALAGAVVGRQDLLKEVFSYRELHGGCVGPMEAYLALRGLKTLELRIQRHNANALQVAEFLESHPAVSHVYYPGLPSHKHHHIAAKQMHGGFGGMLAFELVGGMPAVERLLKKLKIAHRAASLGHVETLVGIPLTTSHPECTVEERAALGIPETLVRYSAGIETGDDLVADLRQALEP